MGRGERPATNVYVKSISICQGSIAGVLFSSVRRFRASLLLRTTCMRLRCNWVASCVAAQQTKNQKPRWYIIVIIWTKIHTTCTQDKTGMAFCRRERRFVTWQSPKGEKDDWILKSINKTNFNVEFRFQWPKTPQRDDGMSAQTVYLLWGSVSAGPRP